MPPIKSGKPRKPKKTPAPEREVRHPQPVTAEAWGDAALTSDKAKELLGWEEVTDNYYQLTDRDGKKVRFRNSQHNREFKIALADTYVQEILNKRWQLSGSSIDIGQYGEVLSGQHRLAAIVLAEQDRQKDPRWAENWPDQVTLSTWVHLGIDESDVVVNTIDTGRPRTLSDTIYRSEHFADLEPKKRAKASRACDWAIRLVQLRIGVKDAFNPRRTHGASLEFLDNHLTLRRAVRHVCEEDSDGKVSEVITPGYASALLYLMAASKTDPDQYLAKIKEGDRREKYLDLSLLDRAEEFWLALAQGAEELRAVHKRLANYASRKNSLGQPIPVSLEEKIAVLALAWKVFAEGGTPELKDVTPRYHPAENEDDPPLLKDTPLLGGIDLGEDHDEEAADVEEDGDEGAEEEEDPVEAKKAELDSTREQRIKDEEQRIKGEQKANQQAKAAHKDDFDKLQAEHPGRFVLYRSKSGGYIAGGEQAEELIKLLRLASFSRNNGSVRAIMPDKRLEEAVAKLHEAGHPVTVLEEKLMGQDARKTVVATPYDLPTPAKKGKK